MPSPPRAGEIGVWSNGKLVRLVRAHAKGPLVTRTDGTQAYGGLVQGSLSCAQDLFPIILR